MRKIEHVMPQTLTPQWIDELGDGAQEHHARLLHSIGNLTLTGYNLIFRIGHIVKSENCWAKATSN